VGTHRRFGPIPAPQRRINPRLSDAVNANAAPQYILARRCGFPVGRELSHLLHADRIPATALTVHRQQVLASLIGFPPDDIFIDDDVQGAR
jgi:hypothetical protein